MAQGVAWGARERGIPCTVVVPDHAPQTKLDAIERLGGRVVPVPFEDWWRAIETSQHPGAEGYFVHPVLDDGVMAGNGTIGLEILDDLPDVDTVLVPWGGGGLTSGIASALQPGEAGHEGDRRRARDRRAPHGVAARARVALRRLPRLVRGRLGQPRAAAEDVGPRAGARGRRGLGLAGRDGGGRAPAWPSERASSPREPARSRWQPPERATEARGKVVCIVSGGNIDTSRLVKILAGETPD